MLLFFLKILNQKPAAYVCVQLLQTLNILFENIRHETSLCKYIDSHDCMLYNFYAYVNMKR